MYPAAPAHRLDPARSRKNSSRLSNNCVVAGVVAVTLQNTAGLRIEERGVLRHRPLRRCGFDLGFGLAVGGGEAAFQAGGEELGRAGEERICIYRYLLIVCGNSRRSLASQAAKSSFALQLERCRLCRQPPA
jgi:hypothetical protein